MKSVLGLCAALLLLGFPARPSAASPYKQADAYFGVRNRARVLESFVLTDVQTQPAKFSGKLLEVRGELTGIAVSDTQTTLVIGDGQTGPSYAVALPAGKEAADWPFLVVGARVRLLCHVVVQSGGANGSLELRVPVKDDEAEYVARQQAQEAAKAVTARKSSTPRKLGSRGVSASARPGSGVYSDPELVAIYGNAVRYFNRRLTHGDARTIAGLIIHYSRTYGLDARLVMAVIACESNFNKHAVSSAGAQGLGQLMPGTAAGLGVGNSFDVSQNLEGSTRLLRSHIRTMKRGGRPPQEAIRLALACYNAGAGAVKKYKGIPPYRETQQYVKKITRLYWQMLPAEERTWKPD